MELSIIIPAYNEEKRLKKTLDEASEYLSTRYKSHEIIIVDDCSSDKTAEIAEEFANKNSNVKIVKNKKNMGKGYSVKKGALSAEGERILFTDADMSTPITEIEKLDRAVDKGYDIAIASRAHKDSAILKHQNLIREYMGKIFNALVHLILSEDVRDTQCGFKLFSKKAAKDVFSRQKINGFAFDAELLYIARRLGYRVESVPITWSNSPHTKVKLFFSPVTMIFDLIRVKYLHNGL